MCPIFKRHVDLQVLKSSAKETTYIARRLSDGAIVLVRDINLQGVESTNRDEIIAFYNKFSCIDTETVVKIYRMWPNEENDRLLVEVEHIQGKSLLELLNKHSEQQKPIEEAIIWDIAESVADALAHLHSKFNCTGPLVYKALRPENVLIVDDNNSYKLCDCYCYDSVTDTIADGTEQALIYQTSSLYRAPEQKYLNEYTTKTDIWSFGCLLLHLCSSEIAINEQKKSLNLQRINLHNYSMTVFNVINKCLACDPKDRPSAADLVLHIRHNSINDRKRPAINDESVYTPPRVEFGRRPDWRTPAHMVQIMPRVGVEVDSPTPLMLAAERGDADQLQEHMDYIGKVDWQGTALIKAARKGHTECVSALLSELGIQSRRGWTALQDAAYSGHRACIPLLMIEACIQRPDGHTALMGAARNGHQDCVKLLRNREMRMTTTSGRTALMYAAENNHPQCVRLLLDEAGMQDVSGNTALIYASLEGNVDCVALLAIYEAILSNNQGETALQLLEKRLNYTQKPLLDRLRICIDKLSLRDSHSSTSPYT